MHWFPSDLKILLNKMVSFGIARLVSSLNHLIMAIMKWFPFMFWHFEEYFWASDILRVLMTNENNYNIEMLIVLSTNLRTLCPRLIVCSTFYTFDNKPEAAMPKNNCRFYMVNNTPEVAMPKNAPFALKHLFASGQNEQSSRLRKISKGSIKGP